jgi:hypothetical protein
MPKRALSVTLDVENVTWLKGRARGGGLRSVSELVDRIVTAARAAGHGGTPRTVVGTIDIDAADPLLEHADGAVRSLLEASVGRPLRVRDERGEYRAKPGNGRKKRRG